MVFRHLYRYATRQPDFDVTETWSTRATGNADDFLDTRRIGGMMAVMMFPCFRWTEGEPAHVDSAVRCSRQSRSALEEGAILSAVLSDDIQRMKSLDCKLTVGKNAELIRESEVRNAALKVAKETGRDRRYLNAD
jgi:hypothetical protein